eukprot:3022437-Pyramimonas_sp.AAC.2
MYQAVERRLEPLASAGSQEHNERNSMRRHASSRSRARIGQHRGVLPSLRTCLCGFAALLGAVTYG